MILNSEARTHGVPLAVNIKDTIPLAKTVVAPLRGLISLPVIKLAAVHPVVLAHYSGALLVHEHKVVTMAPSVLILCEGLGKSGVTHTGRIDQNPRVHMVIEAEVKDALNALAVAVLKVTVALVKLKRQIIRRRYYGPYWGHYNAD